MTRIVRTAYRYKRPPRCWHLMALGLCAMIVVTSAALGADSTFDGVYIGKRVLTKGSDPTCPDAGTVSVTLRGEALTFTNSRLHSISIGFKPQPNGSFSQISAGGGGAFVSIKGHIVGDAIEADVADSVCEHHWHVVRTAPPS